MVPIFHAKLFITELAERLFKTLQSLDTHFEIIFVNDASPDGSGAVATQLGKKIPNIKVINLPRRLGQRRALLAGIEAAQYSVIITMDDDLEHPPEAIPCLMDALAHGHDLVYAVPSLRPRNQIRNWASTVALRFLSRLAFLKLPPTAFRAFDARLYRRNSLKQSLPLDLVLGHASQHACGLTVPYGSSARCSNYGLVTLIQEALIILFQILKWRLSKQ
ncbi:MAG: glycosyltransferase [Deltaproteobacteria bacterium]|nr:glycosyltransferase [Deltaproteobacteria bacterium]